MSEAPVMVSGFAFGVAVATLIYNWIIARYRDDAAADRREIDRLRERLKLARTDPS